MASSLYKDVSGTDLAATAIDPILGGNLRPIIPRDSSRYSKASLVSPEPATIRPGMFLLPREPEPSYLPRQWTSHIHPEGQLYFYRSGTLRVVTECNLHDAEMLAKVLAWIKRVELMLLEQQIQILSSIELYIEVEDVDCSYYLADNGSRTIFWPEYVETDVLGLPNTVSPSHLKNALEEQFWSHVEHFPMHFGGLPTSCVDDLICIFSHGLADQMTSDLSTFEHTKEECEGFLALLKTSRDYINDGRQTCLVARLHALIASYRVNTHHGEVNCRLSRTQALLEEMPSGKSRVLTAVSCGVSDHYLTRLNDVFVDRLVHVSQWRRLVNDNLKDWRLSFQIAFAFLILHALLLFSFSQSLPKIGFLSILLFGLSLVASAFLMFRYNALQNTNAFEGQSHLSSVYSENHGFRHVALLYSIPSAATVWGVATLWINSLYIVAVYYGLYAFASILVLSTLALVAFLRISAVDGVPSFTLNTLIPKRFRREKKGAEDLV